MESKFFTPLRPPTFILCDDVRSEIGGKFVLVGVYPGNVIVLRNFPAKISVTTWMVFTIQKGGNFRAKFRHKMQDGSHGGMGTTSFANMVAGKLTTCKVSAEFELSDPQTVELQLQFPDEDWTTLGQFEIERLE